MCEERKYGILEKTILNDKKQVPKPFRHNPNEVWRTKMTREQYKIILTFDFEWRYTICESNKSVIADACSNYLPLGLA